VQDRKYIGAFQAGDYSGFEYLYEKYIDVIFAFILRKTSDKQITEDICSQVWIKVLKSLEFF
jgi:DNA-directed RNA polymerase specialized sigma24 family protein